MVTTKKWFCFINFNMWNFFNIQTTQKHAGIILKTIMKTFLIIIRLKAKEITRD